MKILQKKMNVSPLNVKILPLKNDDLGRTCTYISAVVCASAPIQYIRVAEVHKHLAFATDACPQRSRFQWKAQIILSRTSSANCFAMRFQLLRKE